MFARELDALVRDKKANANMIAKIVIHKMPE